MDIFSPLNCGAMFDFSNLPELRGSATEFTNITNFKCSASDNIPLDMLLSVKECVVDKDIVGAAPPNVSNTIPLTESSNSHRSPNIFPTATESALYRALSYLSLQRIAVHNDASIANVGHLQRSSRETCGDELTSSSEQRQFESIPKAVDDGLESSEICEDVIGALLSQLRDSCNNGTHTQAQAQGQENERSLIVSNGHACEISMKMRAAASVLTAQLLGNLDQSIATPATDAAACYLLLAPSDRSRYKPLITAGGMTSIDSSNRISPMPGAVSSSVVASSTSQPAPSAESRQQGDDNEEEGTGLDASLPRAITTSTSTSTSTLSCTDRSSEDILLKLVRKKTDALLMELFLNDPFSTTLNVPPSLNSAAVGGLSTEGTSTSPRKAADVAASVSHRSGGSGNTVGNITATNATAHTVRNSAATTTNTSGGQDEFLRQPPQLLRSPSFSPSLSPSSSTFSAANRASGGNSRPLPSSSSSSSLLSPSASYTAQPPLGSSSTFSSSSSSSILATTASPFHGLIPRSQARVVLNPLFRLLDAQLQEALPTIEDLLTLSDNPFLLVPTVSLHEINCLTEGNTALLLAKLGVRRDYSFQALETTLRCLRHAWSEKSSVGLTAANNDAATAAAAAYVAPQTSSSFLSSTRSLLASAKSAPSSVTATAASIPTAALSVATASAFTSASTSASTSTSTSTATSTSTNQQPNSHPSNEETVDRLTNTNIPATTTVEGNRSFLVSRESESQLIAGSNMAATTDHSSDAGPCGSDEVENSLSSAFAMLADLVDYMVSIEPACSDNISTSDTCRSNNDGLGTLPCGGAFNMMSVDNEADNHVATLSQFSTMSSVVGLNPSVSSELDDMSTTATNDKMNKGSLNGSSTSCRSSNYGANNTAEVSSNGTGGCDVVHQKRKYDHLTRSDVEVAVKVGDDRLFDDSAAQEYSPKQSRCLPS